MIEFMYSRIITTIASVALVAVVASAAIGASEQASFRCAVDIAESITEVIAEASISDAEYFEQRLLIGSEGSTSDLTVMMNNSFVEVEKGKNSIKRVFEHPVGLLAHGERSESLEAQPGSIIIIRSSKEIFQKENNVTIEVVAASSSSYRLSNGGDEPIGILAVVVDVEGGAGRSVCHPPVLEHRVRTVHA
jgi:hypothetical protein